MSALLSMDLTAYIQLYEGEIYRTVEGQHFISTRKLTLSDAEQWLLEEVIDASKPAAPTRNSRGALHYLLYTPFRYPPLQSGARFHKRWEHSLFYGSEDIRTSLAEIAYGRFLFMAHTEAIFEPMQVPYTHFVSKVKSHKALRLADPPFAAHRLAISHPTCYRQSQKLGAAMFAAGIEVFTYEFARQLAGMSVGVFSVEAFAQNKPLKGKEGHWSVYMNTDVVEFHRMSLSDDRHKREVHVFTPSYFEAVGNVGLEDATRCEFI